MAHSATCGELHVHQFCHSLCTESHTLTHLTRFENHGLQKTSHAYSVVILNQVCISIYYCYYTVMIIISSSVCACSLVSSTYVAATRGRSSTILTSVLWQWWISGSDHNGALKGEYFRRMSWFRIFGGVYHDWSCMRDPALLCSF